MPRRLAVIRLLAVLLLMVGAAVTVLLGWPEDPPPLVATFAPIGLALLALHPVVRGGIRRAMRAWKAFDASSPAKATTVLVLIGAGAVLPALLDPAPGWPDGLPIPSWHDEFAYLLQTRTLAEQGRVWQEPHELAAFFDTFHVVSEPVYAAMFPPGTAMLYAPLLAIGLPWWIGSLALTAVTVGLTYRAATALLGAPAGLAAALLVAGSLQVRVFALMLLSQAPAMFCLALLLRLFVAWHNRPDLWRAAAVGTAAGLFALVRPMDALCLSLPIALVMLWTARRHLLLATIAGGLIGVAPLAAVQAYVNLRTTGSPLTWLHTLEYQNEYPEFRFAFAEPGRPATRPQNRTGPLQKQLYRENFVLYRLRMHTVGAAVHGWLDPGDGHRMRQLVDFSIVSPVLFALLPLAGLVLRRAPLAAVAGGVVLFVGVYVAYPLGQAHYFVALSPAIAILVTAGARQATVLARRPANAWPALWTLLLTTAVLWISVPVWFRSSGDTPWATINDAIRQVEMAGEPAILLFRFGHENVHDIHIEPVYNAERARIDDNPIIRAHDLGDRNTELFAYYARHQPDRQVFHFDRSTNELTALGRVRDLVPPAAAGSPATMPQTSTPSRTPTTRPTAP